MPTDVLMPQMGESIFEGTITKWLKKPGEKVSRDEPLFEISTDKVDAEIPAPAAGVLREIKVKEGATVQVNTVVGVIDAEGGAAAAKAPEPPPAQPKSMAQPKSTAQADGTSAPKQPPQTESAAPVQEEKAPAGANGGAATDVVMPQMGESIFEGTITKWLKKVGDKVQRDEPLFEISTDKVDAEIPAPTAGILREIKVKEGTTVQVNSVVAVIGGAEQRRKLLQSLRPYSRRLSHRRFRNHSRSRSPCPWPIADRMASVFARHRWCAAWRVRTMLILAQVPGTGLGGRISKQDIQNFIQQHGAGQSAGRPQVVPAQPRPAQPQQPPQQQQASQQQPAAPAPRPAAPPAVQVLAGESVPMTPMRKKIAEHMVMSKRTSAHVHWRLRNRHDPHRQVAREDEGQVRAGQRRQADVHSFLRRARCCTASACGPS